MTRSAAGVQNNFHIEARTRGSITTLAVRGELDLASSPLLRDALERASAAGAGLVIIDLRELTFMDSTGLSVLVKAHRQALDAGHRLALVKGGTQVQRILTLTRVAEHLVIVDDPDQLLERSA